MVRLSKKEKRFFAGLLVAAIISLAFCLFAHSNLFYRFRLQSSDFLFGTTYSNTVSPDEQIVIVAVDDASLERMGLFSSWPRSYHARLIDTLAENQARIIAFDILFTEPSPDDDKLAAAIKRAGNVILPFGGKLEGQQDAMAGQIIGQEEFIKPLILLEESALAVGHAYVIPDEDGVVRRLPVVIPSNDSYEPSLALATVAKYLRRQQIVEAPVTENLLTLAGRSIPLDSANRMLIHYTGNPSSTAFKTVPYADVLRGDVPPDTFEDKIVIVGITALGFGDNFWTPMERMVSGVELHAQAMHTILTGNFLKPVTASVTNLFIMLLSLVCGLAVLRLRVLWAIFSAIILTVAYFLTAFYFFDRGIMMDLWYPPLSLAGTFVGVSLFNITAERIEKGEIARTFGRYVSPSVATKIFNALNEGTLMLHGEECTATILFADVRNFTTFSENTGAKDLVNILNQYLSVIIKIAIKHDGMVNKFGGDSVMVVWNVPIDCPQHPLAAVRAAINMQQEIGELLTKDTRLPQIEFGIGVNTGIVVAGNMGSTDRMEYSVIGDAVNIASKLASNAPGGRIWVGSETYAKIKDNITTKQMEPLSIKGRHADIQIYEISDVCDGEEAKTDNFNKSVKVSVTNHESCV